MNAPTGATRTAFQLATIIGEAIHAAGPRGVPSGHLYAAVMSYLNLDTYNRILSMLQRAGLVRNSGHLLTWTGPDMTAPTAPTAPPAPTAPTAPGSGIVVNKLPRRRSRKVAK